MTVFAKKSAKSAKSAKYLAFAKILFSKMADLVGNFARL